MAKHHQFFIGGNCDEEWIEDILMGEKNVVVAGSLKDLVQDIEDDIFDQRLKTEDIDKTSVFKVTVERVGDIQAPTHCIIVPVKKKGK